MFYAVQNILTALVFLASTSRVPQVTSLRLMSEYMISKRYMDGILR